MRGFRAGRVIGVLLAIAILVLAVWFFSQDHQPPEIKSLGFKSRVARGEAQEVFIVVVEKEPAELAFLRFNSSTVQVPLAQKFGNGTVVYNAGFDPSTILAGEGLFTAELIVRDEAGNEARRSLEFLANLEAPLIKNASVEGGLGGLEFWVEVDEDNLREVFVEYDGRKAVLTKVGAKFFARVEPDCTLDYTVKAVDAFNLSSSLPVEAPLSEVSLYCSSPLFREIYSKDRSLASSILTIAKDNGSALPKNLAYQVLDQIERDDRVNDKLNAARNVFNVLNELNISGLIHKSSIYIPGNYSQALLQGLPKHSAIDIKRLFDASEACEDIVDFEPIIIRDVAGNVIRIESKDLAREYWILTELLKNRPEIAKQEKKFEWINHMVQQSTWKIFEDEYGPSYFDKKSYKPNDSEVWQVLLGFHDYMDSLPEKLKKDDIPIVFPYWDSEQLRQAIADKTNRTIALFYLADLPEKTLDKANYVSKKNEAWDLYHQGKIDRNTLGNLIEKAHKESIITGIKGMEKFVEQLPKEYEEIKEKYKNTQYRNEALMWFANWLADRGNHGLANTVSQFIGVKYPEGIQPPTMDELKRIIEDENVHGITQTLKKIWPPWDLAKFIYGYESFKSGNWGGEWEMYRYGLPIAFKAFGIPHGAAPLSLGEGLNIPPNQDLINKGAPSVEWAVSLPDYVVSNLKQNFSIVIGYGNYFSLFSCKNGLDKDGATGIYQLIRGNHIDDAIYLWKK